MKTMNDGGKKSYVRRDIALLQSLMRDSVLVTIDGRLIVFRPSSLCHASMSTLLSWLAVVFDYN